MSIFSSLRQAASRIFAKWLTPDVDEPPKAPASSSPPPSRIGPGDDIRPDKRRRPVPGPHPGQPEPGGGTMMTRGRCGKERHPFPPPPTPLEVALSRLSGARMLTAIDGCGTSSRFPRNHPPKVEEAVKLAKPV